MKNYIAFWGCLVNATIWFAAGGGGIDFELIPGMIWTVLAIIYGFASAIEESRSSKRYGESMADCNYRLAARKLKAQTLSGDGETP